MKKLPVFLKSRGTRGWLREDKGSFTLESVFVFPVMLALIFSFIFFSLYFYQNVVVYYSASAMAESAAFNWDNSHRDVRTGMLKETRYDGLYWRIGTDGALGSLLGSIWKGEAEAASVSLPVPSDEQEGHGSLARRKLMLAGGWVRTAELPIEGEIRLVHEGLSRYVEANLTKPIRLFPGESGGWSKRPAALARSYVTDPVEFVRTVDLLRYYGERLAAAPGGKSDGQARAAKVLSAYGSKGQ